MREHQNDFNAEDAEVYAKERRGKTFARLCEILCVPLRLDLLYNPTLRSFDEAN
jgi:hypothetical protein